MKTYNNLVFDIGNVIVDIDFDVIVAEFQKLAGIQFGDVLSYSTQHPIFDAFDRGTVMAQQFRDEIRKFLKPGVTDEEINRAWNSILVHYPDHKFQLLLDLKPRYKTFALSNINEIHVATINGVAQKKFKQGNFEDFFHKAYYSNEVGHRKPDAEIYHHLLEKEGLVPAETFFVDDKEENVDAARRLGIQAFQLKDRDKLHDLLVEHKII